MKIVFFGNNWVGVEIFKRLLHEGGNIIGLVLHPDDNAIYKDQFLEAASSLGCFVLDASDLRKPDSVEKLKSVKPDIFLSVMFGYILNKEVLDIPKSGCINIHNGYLPYSRGVNATVWNIIEGTPAGATIHYMDEGIDTGDIIARCEVPVLFSDTGETLYKKCGEACISLFEQTWKSITENKIKRISQNSTEGSFHKKSDLAMLDKIYPEKYYKGQELIDILRARTYPPFSGAYVVDQGKKYFLKLSIRNFDNFLEKKDRDG